MLFAFFEKPQKLSSGFLLLDPLRRSFNMHEDTQHTAFWIHFWKIKTISLGFNNLPLTKFRLRSCRFHTFYRIPNIDKSIYFLQILMNAHLTLVKMAALVQMKLQGK